MKKLVLVSTITYEIEDGFRIDVVLEDDVYEVWFYHKDYGIKTMIFGMKKKDVGSVRKLVAMAIDAINERFRKVYREEYMDD